MIILIIISFLCGLIVFAEGVAKKNTIYAAWGVAIMMSAVFVEMAHDTKKTAKGDYKDTITMEITYKNGVPIDSVVISNKK